MASFVRMKKNGKIYLYKSTCYWHKEKKAPRTKMEYLGIEDPITKKVTTPLNKYSPKIVKDFGNFFLFNHINQELEIETILKTIYPYDWDKILSCVFFEFSESKPLYLCNSWLETTYNRYAEELPSQRISELLKRLGEDTKSRLAFSEIWMEKNRDDKYYVFDITSISSYSKLIDAVEWGYNRDKESIPQINFGLIYGQPSELPLFYNIYPGSIRDVTTLKNIFEFLNEKRLKRTLFIFDKGFYSEENIVKMLKKGINFIIPMPKTVKKVDILIKKHKEKIIDIENSIKINKDIINCIKDKITIDKTRLKVYIFFDKKKKAENEVGLIGKIIEAEDVISIKRFRSKEKAEKYYSQNLGRLKNYFRIKGEGGIYKIERDREEIIKEINRMGYIIIISTKDMRGEEIIRLYRQKDGVEKCFNNMKNELSLKRLRVHRRENMEGRIFISFITTIFYSLLSKKMRETKLNKKYSIEEIKYELKKLKMIELKNGKKLLTEITKKQKEILTKIVGHLPDSDEVK